MCRREVSGPEGLIAVFDHLDHILPKGVMLHGFGVKGTALSHLKGIEHRIASIDSQAYGQAARHDAFARGVAKTDTLVAQHMQAWPVEALDVEKLAHHKKYRTAGNRSED